MGLVPIIFDLFQHGYAFNTSSIAIHKEILEEVGGFPDGVKTFSVVACWVKIALRNLIAIDSTRAVIYHQDAQIQLGSLYKITQEFPYFHIIQVAIASGYMPGLLQESAIEFMAQKQILVAAQNVMSGYPAYARQMVETC